MNAMSLPTFVMVLVSVAMICCGQLLFKEVGNRLAVGMEPTQLQVVWVAAVAIGIYGLATLLWIHILRSVPLTRAYPFMALSFVIVPLGSILFFAEHVRPQYFIGTALIVAGVVVTTLSNP